MTSPPVPPAQQAQVRIIDRLVLAVGLFPAGSPDPDTIEIVDLDEEAWAEFQAAPPGDKYLAEDGTLTVVPPPPPPLRYEATTQVNATLRTTNDTPTEIYRYACGQNRTYTGALIFQAVNPTNWATRSNGMRYAFKRVTAGAVLIGEAPVFAIDESGSASWNVEAIVSGNDFIVRVIGGRTNTVDWLVTGDIQVYVPAGF